jgi:glutathione S-transferase
VISHANDLGLVPLYLEKDPEKLQEKKIEITKTVREKYLDKFEVILKANGDSGRLVGKNLTWADIYLAYVVNNAEIVHDIKLLTDDYPALKKLSEKVFSVPQIKAWIEKRPKTRY